MNKSEQFNKLVDLARDQFPEWREGQTQFNMLRRVDPALAERIRSTENDPFYNDDRLEAFWRAIHEEWSK